MHTEQATSVVTTDKLIADLKIVMNDAEEILRNTAGQAGEKAAELRERLTARVQAASERLRALEDAAVQRTKAVARATDDYVHEHPWQSIGIAAGVGFLIGLLVGRR
jgi:ElaB/YqjD/DUF883 family membrane-anchored ribosome-binding protein